MLAVNVTLPQSFYAPVGWPEKAILCMILQITLNVNRKRTFTFRTVIEKSAKNPLGYFLLHSDI